jgi:aerotaxis receptor
MRINTPVTGHEHAIEADATLMSTTDERGKIRYANAAFILTSGFTEDELINQPHNIVRHPDMPEEAFKDMWDTLKAGQPWTGLVKNRRKNGDHYWVRANAAPVVRQGKTQGYISVRTTPSRDEINVADSLYQKLKSGQQGGIQFRRGILVNSGWRSLLTLHKTASTRARLYGLLVITGITLAIGEYRLSNDLSSLMLQLALDLPVLGLLAWALISQLAKPIEELQDQALKVASGERLTVDHMDRCDEVGMTLRAISQLGLMFRWLINDVAGQAGGVEVASSEIAIGNNDLSTRTERAAASVQQTASAMTEMTEAVNSTAEVAAQANLLASSASDAAQNGSSAMASVIHTMDEITHSSRRIADIIGVIDGIAFQTNILALNAAVEAARAGEQGRGFAVVAGEVRNLAQRSAGAAKEIKQLIQSSVDRVNTGSALVNDAGQGINDLQLKVKQVTDLIAEITHAAKEQTEGIGVVGQSIQDLDQITQQNAALVEQSAAAADSLKTQAASLAQAVGAFK